MLEPSGNTWLFQKYGEQSLEHVTRAHAQPACSESACARVRHRITIMMTPLSIAAQKAAVIFLPR
jgi:hypothetical protein